MIIFKVDENKAVHKSISASLTQKLKNIQDIWNKSKIPLCRKFRIFHLLLLLYKINSSVNFFSISHFNKEDTLFTVQKYNY